MKATAKTPDRHPNRRPALPHSRRLARANRLLERVVNKGVRGLDRGMGVLHIGGRKADYDDINYTFIGGMAESLRKKHYDKSLRLLWKAQDKAPWSSFRDCSKAERQLQEMALRALTDEEKAERARINSDEYKAFLKQHYSREEREALVAMLSAIGHGEAYAWLVSSEMVSEVKGTGGKAAVTMQVLEEAKHFVVLRELIFAFDVPVPRLSVWEYLLLEQVLRASDFEKFFGMNIVVEGIALSIFGLLSTLPGLEILRQFHLDESRHTALPQNYFNSFDMPRRVRWSPIRRGKRLLMVLPAVGMLAHLEAPAAVMGYDVFDFGGSILRKISFLADRVGYQLIIPYPALRVSLNLLFNGYAFATRPEHSYRDFLASETTMGEAELAVEREVFGGVAA